MSAQTHVHPCPCECCTRERWKAYRAQAFVERWQKAAREATKDQA